MFGSRVRYRVVGAVGAPSRHLREGHQQRQHHEPGSAQQGVGDRYRVVTAAMGELLVEDRGQYGCADRRADALGGLQGAARCAGIRTGTYCRVSVRLGEVTKPPPSPATSSGAVIAHAASFPPTCRSSSAMPTSPTVIVTSPETVS